MRSEQLAHNMGAARATTSLCWAQACRHHFVFCAGESLPPPDGERSEEFELGVFGVFGVAGSNAKLEIVKLGR